MATGSPPGPVGATPLSQLQGYFTKILPAGLISLVSSGDSDKLFISANVYYDGQYSNIQESVNAALDLYLSQIPFNGIARVSQLESVILSVPGVLDCEILTVKARADVTSFSSATVIYDITASPGINNKQWATVTGYIVQETTTGQTFSDTITYAPISN